MSQRFGGADAIISPLLEPSTGIPLILPVKEPRELLTNDNIIYDKVSYLKNLNDNKEAMNALKKAARDAQLTLIVKAGLPNDLIDPSQREKYVAECETEIHEIGNEIPGLMTKMAMSAFKTFDITPLKKLGTRLYLVQAKISFLRSDGINNNEEQKTRLAGLQGNFERWLPFLSKHLTEPLAPPPEIAQLVTDVSTTIKVGAGGGIITGGSCDDQDDMCILM